jgi:Cu(I)/Ag(I) efflux system membrane fusion protein
VRINAYPDKLFEGKVTYVYPTLNAETRTVPVRVELANPGLLLKPAMFAQVELPVGQGQAVVTVPVSAVIDSGTRQIVLVQQGRRPLRAARGQARRAQRHHVEVIDGVKDGEQVVVAANFLIDAESNLKAAVGGFGARPAAKEAAESRRLPPSRSATGRRHESTSIDAKAGTVSIEHGPVASLKWPAMTMEFKVANDGLLKG